MTNNPAPRSAEIIPFPQRGRFQQALPLNLTTGPRDGSSAISRKIIHGGGWYHEEAIREAEACRKP